jgi:uroporphyrinogen-III synthase
VSSASPRVLVTRALEDAPQLASALAQGGFEPVVVPVLERRWLPLAVAELAEREPEADWVVITSAAAAEVVAIGAPTGWRKARWAAVGPSTGDRLSELGYRASRVPERATGLDLAATLGDLRGQVVIYPKADLAGPALGQALQRAGATVHEVVAYENVAPTGYAERLLAALPVRATTLMSGSAAERVAEAVPEARRHELGAVVVIGPSTATVAQARGLTIAAQAAPHTVTGLVAAVALALGSPRREPD